MQWNPWRDESTYFWHFFFFKMHVNLVVFSCFYMFIDVSKPRGSLPEAQKPLWQGGIAIRKVFARPESFCALKLHWEVSGPFGKFPDSLDTFRIVWKVSR